MTNCRLRPATNEDREAIRALVFAVLIEYGLQPEPDGRDADLDAIEDHYARRGGLFDVLVDEDGEIVGSVALYREDDHTCELRKMYLAAAFRGRGLGRRLLEHVLEQARAMGFSRVTLETASVLTEAIALYRARGFVRSSDACASGRCDAVYELNLDGQKAS